MGKKSSKITIEEKNLKKISNLKFVFDDSDDAIEEKEKIQDNDTNNGNAKKTKGKKIEKTSNQKAQKHDTSNTKKVNIKKFFIICLCSIIAIILTIFAYFMFIPKFKNKTIELRNTTNKCK